MIDIEIGCDIEEFKEYRINAIGNTGDAEEDWIKKDPSHIIVLRENSKIIGHAIWHKSNSREHRPGVPREEKDTRIIEHLLGENKNIEFIELHELWLIENQRGKGYGTRIVDFFEEFVREKRFKFVIFYAYNQSALILCRKRGYKECLGFKEIGVEGNLEDTSVFLMELY